MGHIVYIVFSHKVHKHESNKERKNLKEMTVIAIYMRQEREREIKQQE